MKKILIVSLSSLFMGTAAFAVDKADNKKTKPYTKTTCAVTGEKLGEHGAPYVFNHKDQEVKLCCKGCLKDFNKDPQKYLGKSQK